MSWQTFKRKKKGMFFRLFQTFIRITLLCQKKKTLDIFGYKIDMFHNFCIIAFFPVSLFSIEGPLLLRTCYLLLFFIVVFEIYAGSTILRKTKT